MDRRIERGDKTRRKVAKIAADLASTVGLGAISISSVASAAGISKGGVQVAYATKLDLQLAGLDDARRRVEELAIQPALMQPAGLKRLTALIDGWFKAIESRLLPGGCFFVATLAEFDSQPGLIRDQLIQLRKNWLTLLERNIALGQQAGEVPRDLQAGLLAYEIDSILMAANIDHNLSSNPHPLKRARHLINARLRS